MHMIAYKQFLHGLVGSPTSTSLMMLYADFGQLLLFSSLKSIYGDMVALLTAGCRCI